MLSKEEGFLLGTNVNEPVSIEIPVQVADIDSLYEFLETVGFKLTKDGRELDKILIDQKPNYRTHGDKKTYSIITPALKPEDRKQFYESLKYALDEYKKILSDDEKKDMKVFYPHILDLKNLVTNTTNVGMHNELAGDVVRILSDLEQSKDVYRIRNSSAQEQQLVGIFPNGALLNGSALSDPYSVATYDICRYTRYATIDCSYAIGYSGIFGKKDSNAHTNMSPDGKHKIGFVFEYRSLPRPQQLYFGNTDIESGNDGFEKYNIYSFGDLDDAETVVNRFDNPCIGIYLVWQSVDDPNFYFMYKFEENDPRYQILKQYYATCDPELSPAKHDRFVAWSKEQNGNATHMPITEESQDKIKNNADFIVQTYEYFKQLFKDILTEEKEIPLSFNEPKFEDYLEEKIFLSLQHERYGNIKTRLQNLKKNLQALEAEINRNSILKRSHYGNFQEFYERLQYKIEKCDRLMENIEQRKRSLSSVIEYTIIQYAQANSIYPTRPDALKFCKKATEDIRSYVFDQFIKYSYSYLGDDMHNFASVLLTIYTYADISQKHELFEKLYEIRKKIPNLYLKQIQEQIPNIVTDEQDAKILSELFKKDFLFIKRAERARRLFALRLGKNKVQELNAQATSSRQTDTERDS